jgi:hypothetical protein
VLRCRRDLRKAWLQLVDDVQVAAEAAARQAEVHAWKTQGAAVKVSISSAACQQQHPEYAEASAYSSCSKPVLPYPPNGLCHVLH